jgi:hypothetical protein
MNPALLMLHSITGIISSWLLTPTSTDSASHDALRKSKNFKPHCRIDRLPHLFGHDQRPAGSSYCSSQSKGISMNIRWRMFLAFATTVFICASASTAFPLSLRITSSYTQRKVSSGKFPIHSACMMPPQGYLTKVGVKGAEGMTKESDAWAEALEAIVESHLKTDGLAINTATNPLSSGASNEEIGKVISQVQEKLHTLSPLMSKKPGQIAKSAYTLGDQVGMLPCSENSDILVFVQGAGQVLTGGRATMTLLVGGPAEGATVLVTMADAKTGEIVGLIKTYPGAGFLDNAELEFGERLDCPLADMNIGSARKNAKACGN